MGNKTRRIKVRHGWEWWESFWKWILVQADETENVKWWIKHKKKEFEELWREGKVQTSP